MGYKYRGGKLRRWNELSQEDQVDLLFDLLNAFSLLKNEEETSLFLTDLLTSDEVKILAKRLRVAKLLLKDWKYEEIRRYLKISPSTIAKVAAWLAEKGEGFRRIIIRLPEHKRVKTGENFSDWDKFKRRYPSHFWPGLMMEGIHNSSIKSKDKRMGKVLETLGSKDVIRKRVDEFYKGEIRSSNNK